MVLVILISIINIKSQRTLTLINTQSSMDWS